MPEPTATLDWNVIAALSSVLVALAALLFSIFSFNRQQARAEAYERASVKPLLDIRSMNYEDHKRIAVANHGVGPAVILGAEFRRTEGAPPTSRMVQLFDLDITWQRFANLPAGRAIPAGEEMVLVEQSLDHLMAQGFDRERALALLASWRAQKTGIQVEIAYTDIYGNKMPTLIDTLN